LGCKGRQQINTAIHGIPYDAKSVSLTTIVSFLYFKTKHCRLKSVAYLETLVNINKRINDKVKFGNEAITKLIRIYCL